MATFVIGFGVVVLSAALLAVGLLAGGRPRRAGCRGAQDCGGCNRPPATPGKEA